MKTLKTFFIEATLNFLYQLPDVRPYVVVDLNVLDELGGQIPVSREFDLSTLTLSVGDSAVRNLKIVGNVLEFDCSFDSLPAHCSIPTASIVTMFDKNSTLGCGFETAVDLAAERSLETQLPNQVKEPPKMKPPFRGSHLRVVK